MRCSSDFRWGSKLEDLRTNVEYIRSKFSCIVCDIDSAFALILSSEVKVDTFSMVLKIYRTCCHSKRMLLQ